MAQVPGSFAPLRHPTSGHLLEDMLSRAHSYDALGSFAATPVGQLAPVLPAGGWSLSI